MKRIIITSLAACTILLYSCSGNESFSDDLSSNFAAQAKTEVYEEATETEEGKPMPPKDIDIPSRSIKKIERKLIKEGTISFETDDCKTTKKMIHKAANSLSAYIARDDEYTYNNRIEHNITIRVPSEKFDKLLVEISNSVKELDSQNISVKDVTEEYVDVQARLKAKKIVEKRYLELLSKANSVGDVLQVESELARLREQIEATEGRLRYLKDQVSLSTLNITFYQTLDETEPSFEFVEKILKGFSNGFKGLLWFFIGLANIWPFLLFLGLGTWFIVRLVKKSNRKKK